MKRINRTKAVELIESSKGKFFTVTFMKKNNMTRTINCNYKKGSRSPLGYMNVYSLADKNYRNINPQTITKLSINGNTYMVK
jgi:hypothetical protein